MKAYLLIDGTNLYAAQYELFGPKKYLDFGCLLKELEKQLKIKFNKVYFYILYRAAFFFKTYILDFGRPIEIKFLNFQKKEFIKMDKLNLLKESK